MNSDEWYQYFSTAKKIVKTFSWSFLIFRIQIDLIVITNYWIKHKNWPSLKCHRTHSRDKKECLDFSFRYGAICYLKWLKHENVIEKSFLPSWYRAHINWKFLFREPLSYYQERFVHLIAFFFYHYLFMAQVLKIENSIKMSSTGNSEYIRISYGR